MFYNNGYTGDFEPAQELTSHLGTTLLVLAVGAAASALSMQIMGVDANTVEAVLEGAAHLGIESGHEIFAEAVDHNALVAQNAFIDSLAGHSGEI
jgi:hypothetical protein